MTREDIQEIKRLEASINIEEAYLNFENTIEVFQDFCKKKFYLENLKYWNISEEAKSRAVFYLQFLSEYKNFSEEKRKEIKIESRRDIQQFSGPDSKLIAILTLCLREKYEYLEDVEKYMQDNYFSIFLMSCYRLDQNLAKEFRNFVEIHPLMQKFRV